MLIFANGEFWSKNSTTPSGMNLALINWIPAPFFLNLQHLSIMYNPGVSGFISTCSDSKLHKEVSLTLNKSGTKDRTYWMKDGSLYILDKIYI